ATDNWHNLIDQENPLPRFLLTANHVVELEEYMILWVKDKMGTEGHPLCKNGVAAAKAKAAPKADKPNDITPKDRHKYTQKTVNLKSINKTEKRTIIIAASNSKQIHAISLILRRGHRTRAAARVF
ncbi:MAG: hypothetical protein ACKPKO_52700, partial [Candidatus Fonsibacter sp.]